MRGLQSVQIGPVRIESPLMQAPMTGLPARARSSARRDDDRDLPFDLCQSAA
jgi:hypothetical protein